MASKKRKASDADGITKGQFIAIWTYKQINLWIVSQNVTCS